MNDCVANFQGLSTILNCHVILSGRVAGNTQSNRGFHVSGCPMLKIMFRTNSLRVAAQHYGETVCCLKHSRTPGDITHTVLKVSVSNFHKLSSSVITSLYSRYTVEITYG
ncbi:hypothetical protein IG631_05134 [Alternaria alternata]|nr:hypothetical protein IG631_05134 [Alternaria alternata]